MNISELVRKAFDKKTSRKMALKAYHSLPLPERAKFKADLQKITAHKAQMSKALVDNLSMIAHPGVSHADADEARALNGKKDAGLQKGDAIG